MTIDEASGLVICAINAREGCKQSFSDVAKSMVSEDISSNDVLAHYVVLTPGSLRLKRRSLIPPGKTENYQERTTIKAWSKKSRANMVSRFSSLDLSPMTSEPDRLAVMITLTYPGDWLSLAPTAKHAKRHLQQFRKRFERQFERPCFAMWKAEFQRRGAVHFHLFSVAPVGIQEFRSWVATAWSEIVNPIDEIERQKHLLAGTAVDIAPGASIADARLVAVYFSKHSSANFGRKEYQNQPPEEWTKSGSVGRFWGYWNLKPYEVEARITERELVQLARLIRRWFKSKGYVKTQRVARVDQRGTITFRNVKRRSARMGHSFGFIVLEDSLSISRELSRYLAILRSQ
jgi:hypothetical protein